MLILRRVLKPPEPVKPLVVVDSMAQAAESQSLRVRAERMDGPSRRLLAYGPVTRIFVTTGSRVELEVNIDGATLGRFHTVAPRNGFVDGYAVFPDVVVELIYA